MRKSNEYEMAYARPGTGDDFGEYSYLYTQCGNWWYSVNTNPATATLALAEGQTEATATVTAETSMTDTKLSALPSTGGIGTTIFYVSGGALVVGAAVVLITRKRMSLKEDKK